VGTSRGDLVRGDDGLRRCAWAAQTADYAEYHDLEWGRPVRDDRALFERLSLEAFQSGLSWLTVLRRRPTLREAFAGFAPEVVARYGPDDVRRLLDDPGIIRHRGKVEAVIANARALLELWSSEGEGSLSARMGQAAPARPRRPRRMAEVPASTPGSAALARDLKARGFSFVGPTTCYAALQATGFVDDHLVGCHRAGGS